MPTIESLPAAALQLAVGPWEFADGDMDGEKIPVRLVALSGKPVYHWFWGQIVHDLSGIQVHKDRLAIDYLHDDGAILGYVDDAKANKQLILSGYLIRLAEGDQVDHIVRLAKAGVPYEASIFFSGPLRLEELEPGATVKVNGYTVRGPAIIVREWSLRGVAVCPHGVDRNTATKFSQSDATVQVQFQESSAMPLFKQAEKSVQQSQQSIETPPTGEHPSAAPSAEDVRQQLSQFVEAFGAEHGAAWLSEGKTFDEAVAAHREQLIAEAGQLSEQVTALESEKTELAEKLAALEGEKTELAEKLAALEGQNGELSDEVQRHEQANRGEETPLSASPEQSNPNAGRHQQNLGDRLGRFASGITLPKRN